MKTKVSAEAFLKHWRNVCLDKHNLVYATWPENRLFTSLVFERPNSLFEDIGRALGLCAYAGYYHIDGILFDDEEDRIPLAPDGQTWIRRIRVAFEHENDYDSGLFKEIGHLMILDADLRVLVTYPGREENIQPELQYLHRVISESERSTDFDRDRSFLIIAGYRDTDNQTFRWTGDVFSQHSWLRLL